MPMIFHNKGLSGIAPNAFDQIKRDSDRAVAIVGAAIIEDRLAEFLLRRCASNSSSQRTARNFFGTNGPLGSFGAKIDAAFVFQHITKEAHEDLRLVKDIRNRFAHEIEIDSFAHDAISSRCKRLQLVEHYFKDAGEQIERGLDPMTSTSEGRQVLSAYTNARADLDNLRERFISTVIIFNFFLGREPGDGWSRPVSGPVI
jgi:DNA-binding MltR family transcriptional regulator